MAGVGAPPTGPSNDGPEDIPITIITKIKSTLGFTFLVKEVRLFSL